jgi:hypothetical protein
MGELMFLRARMARPLSAAAPSVGAARGGGWWTGREAAPPPLASRAGADRFLPMSRPGDRHEREADHIADRLAPAAEGAAARARRPGAGAAGVPDRTPPGFAAALGRARARGGEALPEGLREAAEAKLGRSLAGVRVHRDAAATALAAHIGARAFTVEGDLFFREGAFDPDTEAGRHLIAHELGHVVQQGKGAPAVQRDVDDKKDKSKDARDAGVADPAAIAEQVIGWMNFVDPEASGGVGDFAKAFAVLAPLDTSTLLAVLQELEKRKMLDLLYDHRGSGPEGARDRIAIAMLVVLAKAGKLRDRGTGPAHFKALSPADQGVLKAYPGVPAHWQTILFEGEAEEVDRLGRLQQQFEEDKRKAAEEAARKQAEADAKAKGMPPPAPEAAPKVGIGDVVEKEVEKRELKPIPKKQWTDLSEKDKDDWKRRAKAAFEKVRASIKGTELDKVLDGHDLLFDPERILDEGAYAFESGGDLHAGMSFVQDIERDPRNVWPTIAHEIGGHAAYGDTYASKVMNKFLESLPEADRKKFTGAKATGFFEAFQYAETEIFAALRERRYSVPETGLAPQYGGIRPDDNIELRLNGIDAAFPRAVGQAILLELNERVQADPKILARDKLYFVERVRKHGYTL